MLEKAVLQVEKEIMTMSFKDILKMQTTKCVFRGFTYNCYLSPEESRGNVIV